MRILITGKDGYIGNSLYNFFRGKSGFIVDQINVRDDTWKLSSFKTYDVIIHLAALVHKNERKYTFKEYEKVNIDLTTDLAKKAIEEGVKKFIFFSTMAVFGKAIRIYRNSPLIPVSKYGISKLKAEEALISLTSQSKITLTIIRPPMIYGVGAKGNPNFLEKFSKFCCFFPETNNKRSFISIDNLINTLIQDFDNKKNSILHPQDPNYLTTFQLFSYYCSKRNIKPYPLKLIGYLIRKLFFIRSLHKIFGNLYYDFVD
jgi:UDP-glucose 4-epimerase